MSDLKTIAIERQTKAALDALKVHPRETYDDVLKRLVEDATRREAQERRVGANG